MFRRRSHLCSSLNCISLAWPKILWDKKKKNQTKTWTVISPKWVSSTCQKTSLKVQIFARELLSSFFFFSSRGAKLYTVQKENNFAKITTVISVRHIIIIVVLAMLRPTKRVVYYLCLPRKWIEHVFMPWYYSNIFLFTNIKY